MQNQIKMRNFCLIHSPRNGIVLNGRHGNFCQLFQNFKIPVRLTALLFTSPLSNISRACIISLLSPSNLVSFLSQLLDKKIYSLLTLLVLLRFIPTTVCKTLQQMSFFSSHDRAESVATLERLKGPFFVSFFW